MKLTHFEITNFRGIQHLRLDLASSPQSHVHTLVGLNESGKTTVLEAINHFSYKTETLAPLELDGYAIADPHSLIPIAHRSNFNGIVSISTGLELEPSDEAELAKALAVQCQFRVTRPVGRITINQQLAFKNSQHDKDASKNLWDMNIFGWKKHARREGKLTGDSWQKALQVLKPRIPSILYFPNFLFEFPDRIYLEDSGTDDALHLFYRSIIQDILTSLANDTTIEVHILQRAKSGDKNDKKNLEGLLLQMSRQVTDTVFSAWNKMFQQKMTDKKLIIVCDADENGHVYIEFKLEDADGYYLISERSLGFRWFFVFLLLTQYRGFRKATPSEVLFLLDEPASNLHATAQAQLLESFGRLPKNSRIIYTTHSQYLINPDWLESTYVVRNEGLEYGREASNYSAQMTNITVTPYRKFVITHPDKTSYFKPVLDVLEYAPSRLEALSDVVMVEGKNDYYALRLAEQLCIPEAKRLPLLPGMGSGGLDTPIKLYTAWGRRFAILLDSDSEGEKQKQRYAMKFGAIVQEAIVTLGDVDPSWVGWEMEQMFDGTEKLEIQRIAYPADSTFNKTHFARAIQEAILTRPRLTLSAPTKERFLKLHEALRKITGH